MINELVAVLFLGREVAHREHLRTDSFAQHVALGEFYNEIIPLADTLAETCQGRYKKRIEDIPFYSSPMKGDIVKQLEKILERVQEIRKECYPEDTVIQNIVDEIESLFSSTLFKLSFLK